MKTPSERGVTGAWAYLARQEAGLSVEQVAEQMGAKGLTVSAATIRGIESGSKKPGARMLRTLGAVLESVPPGSIVSGERTGDVAEAIREQAASNDRLANAMDRQAAAFTTLAQSIDQAATGVTGKVAGFDELLRGLLVALGGPASTDRDAHEREPHPAGM